MSEPLLQRQREDVGVEEAIVLEPSIAWAEVDGVALAVGAHRLRPQVHHSSREEIARAADEDLRIHRQVRPELLLHADIETIGVRRLHRMLDGLDGVDLEEREDERQRPARVDAVLPGLFEEDELRSSVGPGKKSLRIPSAWCR